MNERTRRRRFKSITRICYDGRWYWDAICEEGRAWHMMVGSDCHHDWIEMPQLPPVTTGYTRKPKIEPKLTQESGAEPSTSQDMPQIALEPAQQSPALAKDRPKKHLPKGAYLEHAGELHSLYTLCKKLQISYPMVYQRFNRSKVQKSLEQIFNELGYPEVGQVEQKSSTKPKQPEGRIQSTHMVQYQGERYTLHALCKVLGISYIKAYKKITKTYKSPAQVFSELGFPGVTTLGKW
jgi:hypothetical protein